MTANWWQPGRATPGSDAAPMASGRGLAAEANTNELTNIRGGRVPRQPGR